MSYQILLGSDKYFVSTDGGGNRQQWFALIREEVGGVDPEPTEEEPNPKLARLRREYPPETRPTLTYTRPQRPD